MDREHGNPRPPASPAIKSIYVPTFLAEVGIGAVLPILSISALSKGAGVAVAAAVVAIYGVGKAVGSIIGGVLCGKWGSRKAAILTLSILLSGLLLSLLLVGLVLFVLAVLWFGVGHGAYHIARQAQLDDYVSAAYRARFLTVLAGIWRIGNFVGPLVGGVLILWWGLTASFIFAAILVAAGTTVAMVVREISRPEVVEKRQPTARNVLRDHRASLLTLSWAIILLGTIRSARLVVLPLWAESLGIADSSISFIVGLSTGIDMLLFYPAGWVMDRFGRLWSGIPSTLLITLGTVVLPFTSSTAGVVVAAILIGLGNGWGSGFIMVAAADSAPEVGRAAYTSFWMTLQDIGQIAGPLVVAASVTVSLSLGMWLLTGIGAVSSWSLAVIFPKYLKR